MGKIGAATKINYIEDLGMMISVMKSLHTGIENYCIKKNYSVPKIREISTEVYYDKDDDNIILKAVYDPNCKKAYNEDFRVTTELEAYEDK